MSHIGFMKRFEVVQSHPGLDSPSACGVSEIKNLAVHTPSARGGVVDFQPQGPYFLAGYSFGGLVLYKVAQQLQAQGQEMGRLALLEPTLPTLYP
jgi:surfactin synthase thioesterase subunit